MLVDFTRPIVDEKGAVVVTPEGKERQLGEIVEQALLLHPFTQKSFDQKVQVHELYTAIKNGNQLDLSGAQQDDIKEAVGTIFGMLVCAQVNAALKGE